MTNLDHDPLTAVFDEFRSRTAPLVSPAGTGSAREAVRTRRRNRNVVAAALSALVVAIPLGVSSMFPHSPAPAGHTATPDVSVSAPAHYLQPGEQENPSTSAPAGGISEDALYSSTLTLPAWPVVEESSLCVTGPLKFNHGDTLYNERYYWIGGVTYADVDHDGRMETFARIFCMDTHVSTTASQQVVAFAPKPGGGVRTLGPVLQQNADNVALCGVRAGANGTIQVETADFPVPAMCTDPASVHQRYVTLQWLTFAWNGTAFVQQGTTDHTPNPYATDFSLSSTDLVLTRQANGHYTGSMTLTVVNTGVSAIPYRTDTVISDGMRLVDAPTTCTVTAAGGGMEDVYCQGAPLAGGATRQLTLRVDSPRRYDLTYVPDTNILPVSGYNDPNETNNRAALNIIFNG